MRMTLSKSIANNGMQKLESNFVHFDGYDTIVVKINTSKFLACIGVCVSVMPEKVMIIVPYYPLYISLPPEKKQLKEA